jgi:hypothetical protein
MQGILERLHGVKTTLHERIHRYDDFSSVPTTILEEALDIVGRKGSRLIFSAQLFREGILGTPLAEEVGRTILEDVTGRLRQNVSALPYVLQSRIEEVAAGVSAFAFKSGWLGGEAGFLSLTASTNTPFEITALQAQECAELMKDTGLIKVYSRTTRKGHEYELWSLSKKIDPALQKIRL